MTKLSSPWVASHTLTPDRIAELDQICDAMQATSNTFYQSATHIGNHAFIEFCGLMNEYIKACRDAIREGIDFTQANVHTGLPLPLQEHHLEYIQEKFSCIYGDSFAAIIPKGNQPK